MRDMGEGRDEEGWEKRDEIGWIGARMDWRRRMDKEGCSRGIGENGWQRSNGIE